MLYVTEISSRDRVLYERTTENSSYYKKHERLFSISLFHVYEIQFRHDLHIIWSFSTIVKARDNVIIKFYFEKIILHFEIVRKLYD